jgi:hypothetical protein
MDYRIFVLDAEDQATKLMSCQAANDDEALVRAREIGAGHYAVEVWKEGRLVERLGGEVQ